MDRIVIPDLNVPRYQVRVTKRPNEQVMELNSELIRIRKQIKELQRREQDIIQHRDTAKIKNKLAKSAKRKNTPYVLYILELVEGKYYVGITKNITKRFNQHGKGKGANWTRLYKPVKILQTIETTAKDMGEAALLEDKLTIDLAMQYGRDNVRGGGYCQSFPVWPQAVYDAEKGFTGL